MEERTRTRARALAQGVEAQMLALGGDEQLARAWRDWTYETVMEAVAPAGALDRPAAATTRAALYGASL